MARSERPKTPVQCDVISTTKRAILIEIGKRQTWVPKSIVHEGDEINRGGNQELHVEAWFVKKEGLLD